MDCRTVKPARPTLIVPCPCCGNRMAVKSAEPGFAAEGDAIIHGCKRCGAELTRVGSLKVAS